MRPSTRSLLDSTHRGQNDPETLYPVEERDMDNPVVVLDTNEGEIYIELFPEKAPISVVNFLQYLDDGHYDETIFHRVVRKFVIQGGGYDREFNKRETRDPIENEATNGLLNKKGTVGMARGPEKGSATDQFYINAEDNPELDHQDDSDEGYGYAVFGEVVDGMDVVKKINWKRIQAQDGFPEMPIDMIVISSAYRFE